MMTEQEFYIWLLNSHPYIRFPKFNPKFLKKYEISKLFLEKFGFHWLNENQQRNLNLEAVSTWSRKSEYIELMYDIPEILKLLPERIRGELDLEGSLVQSLLQLKSVELGLDLSYSQIKSLPQLESIGRSLNLRNSQIQSLPKLESVEWYLDLRNSQIQSLPELKSVGGGLHLQNSQIESLPELESVGGYLNLQNSKIQSLPDLEYVKHNIIVARHKVDYWINYLYNTKRPTLAEKVKIG